MLLNPFDHFVKERLGVVGYVRYVDDFALFGDNTLALDSHRAACREFLASQRLRLHPHKSVISRVEAGTPFLGYRVFPHRRRLPRASLNRQRRRLHLMQAAFARGEVDLAAIRRRLVSWLGHARHADCTTLQTDLLDCTLFSRVAAVQ